MKNFLKTILPALIVGLLIGGVSLGATILFPHGGGTGKDTSGWTGYPYVTSGTWGTSTPSGGGADTDWIVSGSTMYATDTATYVGIGTASPNAPLEVKGAKPGGNVGGFQSGMFHITGAGTAEFSNSVITGHSAYATNTQLWYLGSMSSGDNNIAFINRQSGAIHFYTNNAFRMVIDATGNVGIGTTTPAYTLDVEGDLRVRASSTFGNITAGVWQGTPVAYNYGGTGTSTALALQYLWWGDGAGNLVQVASSTLAGAAAGVTSLNTLTEALTIWGTSNQITVSASGTVGLLLATPQDIAAASSPTFAGLTLTNFDGFLKTTAGVIGTSTIGFTDLTGSATDAQIPDDITITDNATTGSNVASATALASDPEDCGAGNVARSIDASGNLTCSAVDISTDTNLVAGRSLTMSGDSVELDAEIYTESYNWVFAHATTSDTRVDIYITPGVAITITELGGSSDGSMVIECGECAENSLATSSQIASITLDTDAASTTSFTDATIAARSKIKCQVASIASGTSSWPYIIYTIND